MAFNARRKVHCGKWRVRSFDIVEELLSHEQQYLLAVRRGAERRLAKRRRVAVLAAAMAVVVSSASTAWLSGLVPSRINTAFTLSSAADE